MNGPPVSRAGAVFQVVVNAKSAIGETHARLRRRSSRGEVRMSIHGSCVVAVNGSVPTVVWSAEVVDQGAVFAEQFGSPVFEQGGVVGVVGMKPRPVVGADPAPHRAGQKR